MMMNRRAFVFLAVACLFAASVRAAEIKGRGNVRDIVDLSVRPMMAEEDVPGVAVGVSVGGRHFVFDYGIAEKATGRKVTDGTIFEIGSLSKTFTAVLGADAVERGKVTLSDRASKYLPALSGTVLDRVSLLQLATFTAGGLPLQFPDAVANDRQMVGFFKSWKPDYDPGSERLYSNPSIGLFGYLAAKETGAPFDNLMAGQILPGLGLRHTFLRVPTAEIGNYAFGYTSENKPIRVAPGEFDSEAYGIKSTAGDMLRFLDANMNEVNIDPTLRRAVMATHVAFYQVAPMMQGLGWEMLRYPATLDQLLSANSAETAYHTHDMIRLTSGKMDSKVLINKTGSTNGFGSYAAFVPKKKLGIVILANKNIPVSERVKVSYAILSALQN